MRKLDILFVCMIFTGLIAANAQESAYSVNVQAVRSVKAKRIVNTEDAPKAIGPFSQAVEVNGILYISGQLPLDPSSGKMVDGGISEQVGQVMKNIGAVLKAAGYDYSDVVKSTCMLSDMDNFKDFNTVYGKYFPVDPPARATFAVVKLPLGALVEIEAVAIKSK
jgi:2-iminobutanoate/2-iminopropanoate deaminase